MPKEIITNGLYAQGERWIEVGWSRFTGAQISVRSENESGKGTMGLWSDLDRESINKLIRVLRKARDQAFGADA